METGATRQTFWDHLDELRTVVVRIVAATLAAAAAAFCFKDTLFAVVLAPRRDSFVTYRLLRRLAALAGEELEAFDVPLISTGLARQFIVHMHVALAAGLIVASPYILCQLFRFVAPALYASERRHATRLVCAGYAMFAVGILVSYLLVFPLTFRFLGTYQVSGDVDNLITLDSYVATLTTLSLAMGAVFEIPVVAWLLARLGLLRAPAMSRYRRHAIVAILVVAAVITPTSDVFTLAVVALPMWLLYEASIVIVTRTSKKSCGKQR